MEMVQEEIAAVCQGVGTRFRILLFTFVILVVPFIPFLFLDDGK